jgi:hypothetical protein
MAQLQRRAVYNEQKLSKIFIQSVILRNNIKNVIMPFFVLKRLFIAMPEAAKRSDIKFTKPTLQNPGMVREHRGE